MKGKNHLMLTAITIVAFYINFILVAGNLGIAKYLDLSFLMPIFAFDYLQLIFIQFFCFALILLGSIIPDADIGDGHSKVLHSFFAPIGWTYRAIDFFLSIILGRKRGHRELMHSFIGIVLSSLIFVTVIGIIMFAAGIFSFIILILIYLSLIAGQLLHIFQDFLNDRFHMVSGIIYLFLLLAANSILFIILTNF